MSTKNFLSSLSHLVRVINGSIDASCGPCIERDGVCLDENSDDQMDRCFCQTDSDLCHGRTTSTPIPLTQPVKKKYVKFFRLIDDSE